MVSHLTICRLETDWPEHSSGIQVPDGGGVELQIRPPVMLDNALPMPLGVTVWDDDALLTRCRATA